MGDAADRLRASDAERDRVIDALRRHTADGRLTIAEFEERAEQVFAAVTRADLAPVLQDLPPLPAEPASDNPPRRRPTIPVPSGRTLVTIAAVAVAVALFNMGVWWIIFPLMGVFGGCGKASGCSTNRGWRDTSAGRDDTEATDRGDRDLIRV